MGLFDRLFASRSGNASPTNAPAQRKKEPETFFLDADTSSSMGNVEFMRRSNTIRRTFPGTADSPGNKEMVAEVASMEAKVEKMSEGLAGITPQQESIDLTGGIPKPVKKTFAQTMSQAELDQRKKGTAVGVNVPGGPAAIAMDKQQAGAAQGQPQITQQPTGKPGAIDPFKQMVKELNG